MPFRPIEPNKPVNIPPLVVRARTRPAPPSPEQDDGSVPPASSPSSEPPSPKRKHHVVDRSGPNWDADGNFIVGKGRPPRDKQWQPNQSGNPRGPKPRVKLTPEEAFEQAVLEEFELTANGEKAKTNLGLFGLTLMKKKAAQGDRKAAEYVIALYLEQLRSSAPRADADKLLPEEQAMIDALLDAAGWEEIPNIRNRLTPEDAPETDDE